MKRLLIPTITILAFLAAPQATLATNGQLMRTKTGRLPVAEHWDVPKTFETRRIRKTRTAHKVEAPIPKDFDRLFIDGNMRVELKQIRLQSKRKLAKNEKLNTDKAQKKQRKKHRQSSLIVRIIPTSLAHQQMKCVLYQIKNRTLYLVTRPVVSMKDKGHEINEDLHNYCENVNPAPRVIITFKQLHQIVVKDKASLTGKLRSNELALNHSSSGNVVLRGRINLTSVTASHGLTDIRWVDSTQVYVTGTGDSRINLAGNVTNLYGKLDNYAQLNAKALRANRVYLKAEAFASARTTPIESLRAFSSGNSNIFYYKHPKHITRFTEQGGNVFNVKR